jgi:hypothetical protein
VGRTPKAHDGNGVAAEKRGCKLFSFEGVTFGGSGVKPKGTKYKCLEFNVEARPKCFPTKQFLTFHLSFFSIKYLHNSDFIRTFASEIKKVGMKS